MESQTQIEKKYKELMQDVATNDFYKIDLSNRVNCYVCKCRHITKTKDIDSGVTPFIIKCERCNGYAESTMYRDIAPEQQPTMEWYRPSLEDVLKMTDQSGLLEHILKGGLECRKIVPISETVN